MEAESESNNSDIREKEIDNNLDVEENENDNNSDIGENENDNKSEIEEKENESASDTEFVSACSLIQRILSVSGSENSMNVETTAENSPENNFLSIDDFIQSFQDSDEETNSEIVTTFHVKENDTSTKEDKEDLSSLAPAAEESEIKIFDELSQENQEDVNISGKNVEKSIVHFGSQKLGNHEKCEAAYVQESVNSYSDDNEVHHNSLNVSKGQDGVNISDEEVEGSTSSFGSQEVGNRELCHISNGTDLQELLNSSFDCNELPDDSLNASEDNFTCKVCNFKTSISRLYTIHVQNHASKSSGASSDIMEGSEKETENSLDSIANRITTNTVNLSKSKACNVCNRDILNASDKDCSVENIPDKHCTCDLNKEKSDLKKCSGKELRIQLYDVKHVDHELYNGVLKRVKWNNEKSIEAKHFNDNNISSGRVENDEESLVIKHPHIDTILLSIPAECTINNNIETTFKAISPTKNINTEEQGAELMHNEKCYANGVSDIFVDKNNDDNEDFCGFSEILPNTSLASLESTSCTVATKKCDKNSFICKNKILKKCRKLPIFYCSKCSYTSKRQYNLKVHMERKHSRETFFQCKNCKCYKSTQIRLEKHKLSCGKSLNAAADSPILMPNQNIMEMNKYESTSKAVESISNISQSKGENKATVIWNSKNSNKGKKNFSKLYYCSVCTYVSEYNGNVKSHMKRRHPTEKCEPLSKILKSKGKNCKTSVVRNIKNPTRLFHCYQCSYSSQYNGNVKLHMKKRHSVKNFYQCKKCKYYKHTLDQLREHEAKCNNNLRKNTGVSPFLQNKNANEINHLKCKLSSLSEFSKKEKESQSEVFQTKCSTQVSSNRQMEGDNEDSLSSIEENCKKFSCSFCTYSNDNLNMTKQHVLIHTDLRLYKCKYCDFKSNLKKSIRNHYLRYHISNIINNSSEEDQRDVEKVLSELCKVDRGAFNISSLYISVRKYKDEDNSMGSPADKEETMNNVAILKDKELNQSLSPLSVVNEDLPSKELGSPITTPKKRKSNVKLKPRKRIFGDKKKCKESISNSPIGEYLNNDKMRISVNANHSKKYASENLNEFLSPKGDKCNDQVMDLGMKNDLGESGYGSNDHAIEKDEDKFVKKGKKNVSRNFSYSYILSKYLEDLGPIDPIKCKTCNFAAKSVSVFKRHICKSKVGNDVEMNLTCRRIRHTDVEKTCKIIRHTDVEKMLKCEKCKYTTNYKVALYRHKCKSSSVNKLVQNDLTSNRNQNHDQSEPDIHLVKYSESHNHINDVEERIQNVETENKLKFEKYEYTPKSKSRFSKPKCISKLISEIVQNDLSESKKQDFNQTDSHLREYTESNNHQKGEEKTENVEAGVLKCEKCTYTTKSKRFFSRHKCKSSVNKLIQIQPTSESKQNQDYNQTDDFPVKFTESHNHINDISLTTKDPKDKELKGSFHEFSSSEIDLKTLSGRSEFPSFNSEKELDSEKTYNCDHCEFITTSVFILNSHTCNSNSSEQFQNNLISDAKKLEGSKSVERCNPELANKPGDDNLKSNVCRAKHFKCKYCNYATNKIILLMEHSGIIHSTGESSQLSDKRPSEIESSNYQGNETPKLERDSDDLKTEKDFCIYRNLRKRSTIKSPQKLKDSVSVMKQNLNRTHADDKVLQTSSNIEKSPCKNNTNDLKTLETESKILKCPFCPYASYTANYLKRHLKRMHFKFDFYRPKNKNKLSLNKNRHTKLIKLSNKGKKSAIFSCRYCDYKSNFEWNYKRHMKRIHSQNQSRVEKEDLKNKLNNSIQNNDLISAKENESEPIVNVKGSVETKQPLIEISKKENLKIKGNKCTQSRKLVLSTLNNGHSVEDEKKVLCKNKATLLSKKNLVQNKHCVVQGNLPRNNLERKPYKCSKCIFESYFLKSMNLHMKKHSDKESSLFKCTNCSFKSINRATYERHKRICDDVRATKVSTSEKEHNIKKMEKKTEPEANKITDCRSLKESKKKLDSSVNKINTRSSLEYEGTARKVKSFDSKNTNESSSKDKKSMYKGKNCSSKSVNRVKCENPKIYKDDTTMKVSTSEKECNAKNMEIKTVPSPKNNENAGSSSSKFPNISFQREENDKKTKSSRIEDMMEKKKLLESKIADNSSKNEKNKSLKNKITDHTSIKDKKKNNKSLEGKIIDHSSSEDKKKNNKPLEGKIIDHSSSEDKKNKSLKSKITDHSSSKGKSKKKAISCGNKTLSRLSSDKKGITKKMKSFGGKNLTCNSSKAKSVKNLPSQKIKPRGDIKGGRPPKFNISQILKANRNVRVFDCIECKYRTIYRTALTYHMTSQRHKGNLFHCNLCKFKIHNKALLIRHKSKEHKNSKREMLRCTSCDFVTSWKCSLKTHESHFHR